MARPRAHRRTLVQKRQLPCAAIDGESADRAGRFAFEFVNFIHCEKQPPLQIEFEKGRILTLCHQSQGNQRDVLGNLEIVLLKPETINTLALWSREGAGINESGLHQIRV